MKKLKRLLKTLWMERYDFLQILAYILVIGWFGYILRFIWKSDLGIFPKILLIIGGCFFAIFNCLGLHNAFSKDDNNE